ncbi:preprotein translocase subunit SecG [Chloracidobacterium thermophilum]|uniref:preprotein translocase subunit SecG n=1 Tax=Chloracidobacterium thermophilum TaxID=458033 RepID=UPI0007C77039|nr:preprotein translocase subunit SecG [Chloracidobacterium thermophilum]
MPWYAYALYALFALVCLLLIGVVLLQPGKGDIALFGGGSQTAFGPRGAQKPLERVTFVLGGLFMALAFTFSIPGVLLPRSVASGIKDTPPPPKTEQPKEESKPEEKKDAGPTETPAGATPAASEDKPKEENKENKDAKPAQSQPESEGGQKAGSPPETPEKNQ